MPGLRDVALNFVTSNRLGHRKAGRPTVQYPTHSKASMVKRSIKRANISIESIDFATPISAKSKQAWKYAGGSVQRAPD